MTSEEQYHLDVFGFLVIKKALFADEVAWCHEQRKAKDADTHTWPELYEHPVLAAYLEELCGEDYYLDQPVRPLTPPNHTAIPPFTGGNEPLNWSRGYHQQNGMQWCQALVVVWALTDIPAGAGGFHLVPASHKSWAETPETVRQGNDQADKLSIQPELEAGDVLLCVASTLHGMRPWQKKTQGQLLTAQFIAAQARRTVPEPTTEPLPDWIAELPEAAQAIATPSTGGPTPTVYSDGRLCSYKKNSAPFHPSVYKPNPSTDIDPYEFYHWDLCGHLVLRGLMDTAWLDAANQAIQANADKIRQGGAPHRDSPRLMGTPLDSLNNLFALPKPHCDPFRAMIAHPAVVQRLNWMMGSGFRLGPTRAMAYKPGSSGLFLHGGSEPQYGRNFYTLQNGRTQCDSINVAWQLGDVGENDGGFVYVPGSHKARFPLPEGVELGTDDMGMIRPLPCRAGDVVLFMGAAQTHGALPWTGSVERRVALLNYRSANRA